MWWSLDVEEGMLGVKKHGRKKSRTSKVIDAKMWNKRESGGIVK